MKYSNKSQFLLRSTTLFVICVSYLQLGHSENQVTQKSTIDHNLFNLTIEQRRFQIGIQEPKSSKTKPNGEKNKEKKKNLQPKKNKSNLYPPDQLMEIKINHLKNQLAQEIESFQKQKPIPNQLADIIIYLKAVNWVQEYKEYYHPNIGKWMIAVLEEGLSRSNELKKGETPWLIPSIKFSNRGYRSRIDGSYQSYRVRFPASYKNNSSQKYRLDIILHGRNDTLTEVTFLNQSLDRASLPKKSEEYVQLEVYGRGNNAYRWAGERDIFEAWEDLLKREKEAGREGLIDPKRVVLRGFSMGGAGTWQIGLHFPDRFCVIGPGAGFTTTHGYIGSLSEKLPDYQEKCLTIYDAYRYAANCQEVPVVAYSGMEDPQKLAADIIEKEVEKLTLPRITHLIAPKLKHQFPLEWQQKAEKEWNKFAGSGKGRNPFPSSIHFTTYTLQYSKCEWISLDRLIKHYEYTHIDASIEEKDLKIKTKNIRQFRVDLRSYEKEIETIHIDNDTLKLSKNNSKELTFRLGEHGWSIEPKSQKPFTLEKTPLLHGPIDHAFMDSFLIVEGSHKPWHQNIQLHADQSKIQFVEEWSKFMRGKIKVIRDDQLTNDHVRNNHLILFGDPGSNELIKKILPRLPLQWDETQINIDGKTFQSNESIPVLIYPNPLQPNRYIVLNTGHTFHRKDFLGTNALLYPRLGDFAVLKIPSKQLPIEQWQILHAGLFDEFWQAKSK